MGTFSGAKAEELAFEDVEMIEREYMQRLEQERNAPTPDEGDLPQPEAEIVAGDPEG